MKMHIKLNKPITLIFLTTGIVSAGGCGFNKTNPQNSSTITTVNLPHTEIKRQSIGNCWVYGFMGWLESLALKASPTEPLNFSETYMTYRHFEDQLLDFELPKKINTGGGFDLALFLINRYGVMKEGDFIPGEANEIRSTTQLLAEMRINDSLANGELAKLRSDSDLSYSARKKIIYQELNKAFEVDPINFTSKILPSSNIIVKRSANGRTVTLKELVTDYRLRWRVYPFPTDFNKPRNKDDLPVKTLRLSNQQTSLIRRVFKAMNDGYPVVISWFVDFSANSGDNFAFDTLKENGTGRQGYHMTVLEDYTVTGIDPTTGQEFSVGEGEVSTREKTLAMNYGNLNYFVIKNSWGVSPTSTYFRDGTYGYHKLKSDYLFAWLEEKDEETEEYKKMTYTLSEVVLPPGY